MWARTDGLVLKLCEYGYCLFVDYGATLSLHEATSLGMGWSYIVIPLIVGIMIGGFSIYLLMLRLHKEN